MQDKRLFYDRSCRLCRHEIHWLKPRLQEKITLVDISGEGFSGFAGASKAEMMANLHLWDGNQFITGIDATLYYWRLAGFGWLTSIISFAPLYWLADKTYRYWAKKRQQCMDGVCDGS
ncbi:DUF393 domain-containing protein [Lacimicrobium sp. SS2-24]|uniref:thiol-disulfide oxidoreductase DCC family protein n=1 Tax=Lacimicrobium sp. SS2-24 TaxID=2005569 RepID=UPI000B4B3184|nr:DUF393 domain-containing protein [Lacimicrobium sp. SS2-24]